MRMLEAFKQLLNGKRITRVEWGNQYICYNENKNIFELHDGNRIEDLEAPIFTKGNIRFTNLEKTIGFVGLSDDDKNIFYVSEEEQKELDAFKWRILIYCLNVGCEKCKVNSFCSYAKNKVKEQELVGLSEDEIRNFYNLIKIYGNKREGE